MKWYGIRHKKTKETLGVDFFAYDCGSFGYPNMAYEYSFELSNNCGNLWLVDSLDKAEALFIGSNDIGSFQYSVPEWGYLFKDRNNYEVFEVKI